MRDKKGENGDVISDRYDGDQIVMIVRRRWMIMLMIMIRLLMRTMTIINIDQEPDYVMVSSGVSSKHIESDLTTNHELSSFHWWHRGICA